MKKRTTISSLTVFILYLSTVATSTAIAADVDPKLQAAIFVKVLNYDSALPGRSGGNFEIHIVTDGANGDSAAKAGAAFASINGAKAGGKAITVKSTSIADLGAAIGAGGAKAIYLPAGTGQGTLGAALKLAKAKKVPLLVGNEEMVEGGAAVGIGLSGGKPNIVVNLKASAAMGMKLSASLLKLSRVIK